MVTCLLRPCCCQVELCIMPQWDDMDFDEAERYWYVSHLAGLYIDVDLPADNGGEEYMSAYTYLLARLTEEAMYGKR